MTELPNSTYADYNVGPLYTADQVRQYAAAENAALRERVKVLEDALREYANPLNWNEDSAGIRRVWLEPGSTTPATYNGFEAARAALEVSESVSQPISTPI